VTVAGRIVVGVKTKFTSTVKLGNNAERITKLSDFFIGGTNMRKIVLYLEETTLDLDESTTLPNVEWVDEHTEMSLVSSPFVDDLTDEYPSTGRMYVRTNEGNFIVRRMVDADWDEACKIMEEEHQSLQKLIREHP
jgi:hypothetical protein